MPTNATLSSIFESFELSTNTRFEQLETDLQSLQATNYQSILNIVQNNQQLAEIKQLLKNLTHSKPPPPTGSSLTFTTFVPPLLRVIPQSIQNTLPYIYLNNHILYQSYRKSKRYKVSCQGVLWRHVPRSTYMIVVQRYILVGTSHWNIKKL